MRIKKSDDGRHSIVGVAPLTRESSEAAALLVLEQLVCDNLRLPVLPKLYDSKVRYRAEAGSEAYVDAAACVRRGYADAAEIAAWRCAELRREGLDARVMIKREPRVEVEGHYYYYVVRVLLPDGTMDDPVKEIQKTSSDDLPAIPAEIPGSKL